MTDLTPNNLSHLSDAEFNALCPQGEHVPGPEPLSPAAKVVHDAFWSHPNGKPLAQDCPDTGQLAAALRAAALVCKRDSIILLSLADELEGCNEA